MAPPRLKEDVLWLDVPMHQPPLVQVGQGAEQLAHHAGSLPLAHGAVGGHAAPQLATLQQLCRAATGGIWWAGACLARAVQSIHTPCSSSAEQQLEAFGEQERTWHLLCRTATLPAAALQNSSYDFSEKELHPTPAVQDSCTPNSSSAEQHQKEVCVSRRHTWHLHSRTATPASVRQEAAAGAAPRSSCAGAACRAVHHSPWPLSTLDNRLMLPHLVLALPRSLTGKKSRNGSPMHVRMHWSKQNPTSGAPTCHQVQALVRMQDLLQSQDVGVAAQNVQDGHLLLQQLEVLSIGALHRDEDCMRQAYPMRPWPVRALVAARQHVGHGCGCGAAFGQRASKGRPGLRPELSDAGSGCSGLEAATYGVAAANG